MFKKITKIIADELEIDPNIIILDGSGFSSDFADNITPLYVVILEKIH